MGANSPSNLKALSRCLLVNSSRGWRRKQTAAPIRARFLAESGLRRGRCLDLGCGTGALLRRVRDYAQVKGTGVITQDIADKALTMLDVDKVGLDPMDRRLLEAILHKFNGGPVGLDNVAAAIGEEKDTIEDVLEPYLIQQGYIQRTPRGRVATLNAYEHFGVTPPSNLGGLD